MAIEPKELESNLTNSLRYTQSRVRALEQLRERGLITPKEFSLLRDYWITLGKGLLGTISG